MLHDIDFQRNNVVLQIERMIYKVDYEQSLIFLRDSRVGEHTSARKSPRGDATRGDVSSFSRAFACSPEKNEGLLVVYL